MNTIQNNLPRKMEENEEMYIEAFIVHAEGVIESDFETDSESRIFYDESTDNESTDDEYISDNSLLDEICERICIEENEFMNSDKKHGKNYIGFALLMHSKYILDTAISAKSFLRYPLHSILYYLEDISIFPTNNWRLYNIENRLQIMQVVINSMTQEYNVVLKTFWLRIVQRTWKRILRERQVILRKRGSLKNLLYFERRGRHLDNLRVLPGIYGMLKCFP
jgi:hypothetical protein